ncbi:hypothetical protein [Leisingera caerulea]|uniref:hypothetical protein n=1 Tax=Leisingera caerulea TaxID=506591 RepID=UPI00040CABF3|nr:hypothetical protein [Leisingera caerulea]
MRAKDYPLPLVEIACDYCGRHGKYRKSRFTDLVGENTELPQALSIVATDCSEDQVTPDNMRGRCRPYYAQNWWGAARKEPS